MSELFDAITETMEEPRMQDPATLLLAELNNEGAYHLGSGGLDEALRVFTKALKLSARDITGSSAEEELPLSEGRNEEYNALAHASRNLEQVASENCPASSKSACRCRGTRNQPQPKCTTTKSETSEDCTPASYQDFIYDKPIRVIDRYNTPSHAEVSLYVVFNLALCHHLRALAKRKMSESRLRRILKLYKLAYSLQVREKHALGPSHAIAILNNVAQVYKQLGRRKKSETCLQNLLTNIVRLVDCGLADQVDQLDGFLLNLSHLLVSKAYVASAA